MPDFDAQERRNLAEQLTGNPLLHHILDAMESDAIEAMVHAPTDDERLTGQLRVKAARAFRDELNSALSKPSRKRAPA